MMRKDLPYVTLVLIGISVLVFLYSVLISNLSTPVGFSMTQREAGLKAVEGLFITLQPEAALPEVRSGQFWRIITPIFLHFHLLHIAFNSVAMWVLGSVLERRMGAGDMVVLVLVIGIGSNLAEYLGTGPWFGGLSGVVYGLLGYFWIQGRFNPRFGLRLHNHVVYLMLGWFVLCWINVIPNVANWAHTAGLGLGMAAAWVSYQLGRP
jgi:GlpG protein